MKKLPLLFSIITFMILLLCNPNLASSSAITGINLIIYSVIPALLPYVLITNYLIYSNLYEYICSFFQPIIGKLFGISKYGSFVIVLGLLCGYPMGAKLLGELVISNKISKQEGCFLITFCNNCSISFILNYIYLTCLDCNVNKFTLLILIYFPIFFTAILNRFMFKIPQVQNNCILPISNQNPILNSLKTISMLCSYVFIFTIIAYFLKNIIPLNNYLLYPMISFIEMTSGTALLSTINAPHLLLMMCSAVLFGGLSTVFQTFALIPNYLRKYYIIGKLEQIAILIIIYCAITFS